MDSGATRLPLHLGCRAFVALYLFWEILEGFGLVLGMPLQAREGGGRFRGWVVWYGMYGDGLA
jgi:hypothetical protein